MSAIYRAKLAAAIVVLIKKKKVSKRKCWVKNWIQRREEEGLQIKLLRELENEDEKFYTNFCRMSPFDFKYLLSKIDHKIKKKDTHLRLSIPAEVRLVLTLRFLASGDSYHSLMYLFRIPVSTISKIIPEVCAAIFEEMKNEYLKIPMSDLEWMNVSEDFEKKWNFPHCIGALDGKHVVIKAPPHSGSTFYNYKETHSIVLLALVNANYQFLYINIGCNGRVSDGGVYSQSSLSVALEEEWLSVPHAKPLPGQNVAMPYFVLGDEAFALSEKVMKPYAFKNQPGPQRVFNYRHSRARRVVENVFGIASARFRILRRPIELAPKNVSIIVSAICVLHNFLMSRSMHHYAQPGMLDSETNGNVENGRWRDEGLPSNNLLPLLPAPQKNPTSSAKEMRENLTNYFLSREGEVPWQYRYI